MRRQLLEKTIYKLHAQVCQTLGNPKRIEIIDILRDKEMTAGELSQRMGIAKSNLSQHLSILKGKGIINGRREGVNIYYRISNPKVNRACRLMREVLFDRLNKDKRLAEQIKEM